MTDARAKAQPQPSSQTKKGVTIVAALAVTAFLGLGVYGKLLTTKPVDQIEPIPGEYQAVFEAVVGLALLALHRWGVMWAFVALLFSGFSGVTLHRLLIDAESCGCFGGLKIPPEITLSLDAAVVFMSAWLARAWGLRPWGFALTASMIPTLMIAGAVYSKNATPDADAELDDIFSAPPPPQQTPVTPAEGDAAPVETKPAEDLGAAVETGKVTARDALLRIPAAFDRGAFGETAKPAWFDDLRKASDPNASLPWLIYVYNRNCDICQEHLPEWNDARQIYEEDSANGNAAMGVLLIEWEDLIPLKIPTYTWGAHTPITLLVDDGKIVRDWRGESQPKIIDMYFTTMDSGLDDAIDNAIPGTN